MSEQSDSAPSTAPCHSGRHDPRSRRWPVRRPAAGAGAEQTSSDLEVEGAFEREADGAATDTEAAKATGDELR
jgi:hypothetical protein